MPSDPERPEEQRLQASPQGPGQVAPSFYAWSPRSFQEAVRGKVVAAGVTMIALGGFGILMSLWTMGLGFWAHLVFPQEDLPGRRVNEAFFFWFGLVFGGLSLLPNLGIIAGGIAMLHFRSRALALTGAVLALINSCMLGLFGVAVGIWALVVLTSPEVLAAFKEAEWQRRATSYFPEQAPSGQQQPVHGHPADPEQEHGKMGNHDDRPRQHAPPPGPHPFAAAPVFWSVPQQTPLSQPEVSLRESLQGTVVTPGVVMIMLGTTGLICPAFFTLYLFTPELVGAEQLRPPSINELLAAVLILGGMFLLNFFIILGGIAMVRMRRWKLALTGAILCLLQLVPIWFIGLGVGIWALAVLTSPQVRQAFAQAESPGAGQCSQDGTSGPSGVATGGNCE